MDASKPSFMTTASSLDWMRPSFTAAATRLIISKCFLWVLAVTSAQDTRPFWPGSRTRSVERTLPVYARSTPAEMPDCVHSFAAPALPAQTARICPRKAGKGGVDSADALRFPGFRVFGGVSVASVQKMLGMRSRIGVVVVLDVLAGLGALACGAGGVSDVSGISGMSSRNLLGTRSMGLGGSGAHAVSSEIALSNFCNFSNWA
eukprot:10321631-Lingulodinium_polyedra.AAC.1